MLNSKQNQIYPHKILVVDDQRSHLKLIKSQLSRYGCIVITVDSAEEAEQIIEWGEQFSLVITDLKMPWLNGAQFCRRIKAGHPELKICALSGNIDIFDRDELENSGFDGIFQKPVDDNLLKHILEQMLTK